MTNWLVDNSFNDIVRDAWEGAFVGMRLFLPSRARPHLGTTNLLGIFSY